MPFEMTYVRHMYYYRAYDASHARETTLVASLEARRQVWLSLTRTDFSRRLRRCLTHNRALPDAQHSSYPPYSHVLQL